ARAAMINLLNLQIADDRRAEQARHDAEDRLRHKGVSIEQFRRAVILGAKSRDEFGAFLLAQGFTADAQTVLLAELDDDGREAEIARRRRDEAIAARAHARAPLADVARAARLGLIPPAVYQQRLVAEHFTPDDLAIEMDLLVLEIADTQAQRRRRTEL